MNSPPEDGPSPSSSGPAPAQPARDRDEQGWDEQGRARDEPARDRDEQGRARNARPRDGLGRPLPHGASGVQRQPEGVERTPERAVAEAQELLDAGMPFHAHEVFEDAWKSGLDPDPMLWKGLAQLAVGLTHTARGNPVGGARLLRRGASVLEPHAGTDPHGIDVAGLLRWAEQVAGELDGGFELASGLHLDGAHGAPGGAGEAEAGPAAAAARAPRLRG